MRIPRTAGIAFLLCVVCAPMASPLTAVEGSAEDLYWSDPMTVHDYKKKSDLHSVALSIMALSELQFVRLGDGFVNMTTRSKKSPIARSLDSLEYAYSKLPRIEPIQRFGQFWDALQLRQASLSDARLLGSVLTGGYGGITPIMQVRVYKLVVWVEDILYDLDSAVMAPLNWGISSVREEPTRIQSLGYAADGLGFLRWQISRGLKYVGQKIGRFSSDVVMSVEKVHDAMIRRKRKKKHGHVVIYSRMPLLVFQENRSYLTDKKNAVSSGTLDEWHRKIFTNPDLLPEDIQQADVHLPKILMETGPAQEILVAAEYSVWGKTPRELKKYVITSDEFAELIHSHNPPSPSHPAS
ncbi:MAG: hypothetical protein ABH891_04255 [Candidatus Omnitrophota bacterium]